MYHYNNHEKWWLEETSETTLEQINKHFEKRDPWEEKIRDYLIGKVEVTSTEVLEHAVDKPVGQWNRGDSMRVANLLRTIGLHRFHSRKGNVWRK